MFSVADFSGQGKKGVTWYHALSSESFCLREGCTHFLELVKLYPGSPLFKCTVNHHKNFSVNSIIFGTNFRQTCGPTSTSRSSIYEDIAHSSAVAQKKSPDCIDLPPYGSIKDSGP